VRLGLEGLETRLVPTVFTSISGGQLHVTTDSFLPSDDVSIDHVNGFTFVNQAAFPDASITNGIQIDGGFAEVDILATINPVTPDANASVKVGKAGSMQGILASLSLGSDDVIELNDSADQFGKNVTMNVVDGVVNVTDLTPLPRPSASTSRDLS